MTGGNRERSREIRLFPKAEPDVDAKQVALAAIQLQAAGWLVVLVMLGFSIAAVYKFLQ